MEVYNAILADAAFLIIAFFLVSVVFNRFKIDYDETDSKKQRKRSGMKLRIDYGTGCHYLESSNGVLIPRVDENGKHICNKEEN